MMADYEDDDWYEDDEYLYVEDSFAMADELAETSVPSPPVGERFDEAFPEHWDVHDYWMDIEYGTDEYYDLSCYPPTKERYARAGQKRKASDDLPTKGKTKKARIQFGAGKEGDWQIWQGPNVVHRTFQERYQSDEPRIEDEKPQTFALLPDWRQKLLNATDIPIAESETGRNQSTDGGQEENDTDGRQERLEIDPAQLMEILQSKFAGDSHGQQQLQELMIQALTGEGGGGLDELLEKLTTSVLEQVDERGADSGIGQWLSQRGVRIEGEDKDQSGPGSDGAHQSNDPDEGTHAGRGALSEGVETANGKPAVEIGEDKEDGSGTANASQTRSKLKRGVSETAGEAEEAKPSKRSRSYAAPTKSSQKRTEQAEKRTTRATRQNKT